MTEIAFCKQAIPVPCRALGRCLAALDDVHVVTGGFYGVGATVAEAYDAARKARNLESAAIRLSR